MGYTIEFKGKSSDDFQVILYDLPQISSSVRNYTTYAVPGRDGELISQDEYRSNLTISCVFSLVNKEFRGKIRQLKQWLSGTGKLILSESPEYFWQVLSVEHGEIERDMQCGGRFTVNFLCRPFEYLASGTYPIPLSEFTGWNSYDPCAPVYCITGEGICTLTVNGNSMTANVGQNITIDTDRMLAYREDGELQNTSVEGDYEKLWFQKGQNEVSITDGFQLTIQPGWRYEA